MIKQFRVQNYKALRDVTLDLTPMHVLIGPNDSGKTSVLDCLWIISESARRPLAEVLPQPWEGGRLVWGSEQKEFYIGVIPEEDPELEYLLGCEFKSGEVNPIVNLTRQGKYLPPFVEGRIRQEPATQFSKRSSKASEPIDIVARSLGKAHFCQWNPRMLAIPSAFDKNRRFTLDRSGFGLPTCIDDILGDSRKNFGAIEQGLRSFFPELEEIVLTQEEGFHFPPQSRGEKPKDPGKGLAFRFSHMEGTVPAAHASDGLLLMLGYLTLLHMPKEWTPTLLLVEEPENAIHPRRLQDVIGMLRDLIKRHEGTQVIMTTHSPYLVDLFEPQEVTLCLKGDDGAVTAHNLSKSELVEEQMRIFTLGEIWSGQGEEDLAEDIRREKSST
ncbi:MAG: AAA family ATPase [Candidatus Hydrogenedentota bacterium]